MLTYEIKCWIMSRDYWTNQLHSCLRILLLLLLSEVYLTHSWSWALLEKLSIMQLLKNFPAFYGTQRFITVFTRALHWSLFWARSIQSIPSHSISLRSILILFTHLRLGLPSGLSSWISHQYPICIPLLPHFVLHALSKVFHESKTNFRIKLIK
jgi:hypothetical protein